MLYVLYWEVNENMPVEERIQIAQKLTSTGMFPPKDVNVIRWDITPDLWGIAVIEAENARNIFSAVNMWRSMRPGFFKMTKLAPAISVHEVMPRDG